MQLMFMPSDSARGGGGAESQHGFMNYTMNPEEVTIICSGQAIATCRVGWAPPPSSLHGGRSLADDACMVGCTDLSAFASYSCIPAPWECLRASACPESVGVVVGLSTPLAARGIPIFYISTHGGAIVLVQKSDLHRAIETLKDAGAAMEIDSLVL
jgi:hypothetical protein